MFFSNSCFGLTIDYLYYDANRALLHQFSVSNLVFAFMGLFLCCKSFSLKYEGRDTLIQEHHLNSDHVKKPNGSETLTPYTNSTLFTNLTFSWMGPLMSTGYKKILDLNDILQLDSGDSVHSSYPILKSKLKFIGKSRGQVTTFGSAKALLLTARKDILLMALLSVVYTMSSYVGPYLIDTSVRYLNASIKLKNQGFVLVLAFSGAKVVEYLAEKHWYFKLRQIGIRIRAALVAMIYNKGLTLLSQSKRGHTSGKIIILMTVDAERVGGFSMNIHDPWLVLFQVALALTILYKNLGLAFVTAFAATAMVMLVNLPLGKFQENFEGKLMKRKDVRMKATSEILKEMKF